MEGDKGLTRDYCWSEAGCYQGVGVCWGKFQVDKFINGWLFGRMLDLMMILVRFQNINLLECSSFKAKLMMKLDLSIHYSIN